MARTEPEDLDRQLRFHRREWRVQRIGWVCVALFLALALAGLFGGGPLSRVYAEGPEGRVEYERFVRSGAPTTLTVMPATGARHGVSRIEVTAAYLEAFEVESITPEPSAVRMVGEQLVYEFAAAAPGASVSFHLQPQRLWRHRAQLTIDAGAPLEISQLTYP
jgi:hypothetical protein